MRLTLLTGAALLCFLAVAMAQQNSSAISTTNQAGAKQSVIQGCLHGSGGYSLTDQSGATYFLTGDGLSQHVGQKVELEGIHTSRVVENEAGFATSNSSAGTLPTFRVTKITELAATCAR